MGNENEMLTYFLDYVAVTKLGSQTLHGGAIEMRVCRAKINNHEDMVRT